MGPRPAPSLRAPKKPNDLYSCNGRQFPVPLLPDNTPAPRSEIVEVLMIPHALMEAGPSAHRGHSPATSTIAERGGKCFNSCQKKIPHLDLQP